MRNFVSIAQLVVLLGAISYQAFSHQVHEILGTSMLVLVVWHNLQNAQWYKTLLRGKYSLKRCLGTLINVAALLALLAAVVSGVFISRSLFRALPLTTDLPMREIHLASVFWAFLLLSCHLGLHWQGIYSRLRRQCAFTVFQERALKALAGLVALLGLVCFVQEEIISYLFLQVEFAHLNFSQPVFITLGEYIAMLVAAVYAVHYTGKR